jgi:hypothetical protein
MPELYILLRGAHLTPFTLTLYSAILLLTPLALVLYPIVKSELLDEQKSRAKKKQLAALSKDAFWKNIPEKEWIVQFYPELLAGIANNNILHLSNKITEELTDRYHKKFSRWEDQKIGYAFVWMEIELVEMTGMNDSLQDHLDEVKILVRGSSVDYMHEYGTLTAMGTHTRKRKEFQDVLIFKRNNQEWLLDKMKRDAWFWQL